MLKSDENIVEKPAFLNTKWSITAKPKKEEKSTTSQSSRLRVKGKPILRDNLLVPTGTFTSQADHVQFPSPGVDLRQVSTSLQDTKRTFVLFFICSVTYVHTAISHFAFQFTTQLGALLKTDNPSALTTQQ